RELLRLTDQQCEQSWCRVAGGPQLLRQCVIRFRLLRQRSQLREVQAVIIAALLIGCANLRVFERGKLCEYVRQVSHVPSVDPPGRFDRRKWLDLGAGCSHLRLSNGRWEVGDGRPAQSSTSASRMRRRSSMSEPMRIQ